MASGLFFDPLVLLRAAPLISTTNTLLTSHSSYALLTLFRSGIEAATTLGEEARASKHLIDAQFMPNRVIFNTLFTVAACVSNLYVRKHALVARENAGYWFVGAGVLAIGSVAFKVWALLDPEVNKDEAFTKEWVESRLRYTLITMIVADVPALLACWYALARTCVST